MDRKVVKFLIIAIQVSVNNVRINGNYKVGMLSGNEINSSIN